MLRQAQTDSPHLMSFTLQSLPDFKTQDGNESKCSGVFGGVQGCSAVFGFFILKNGTLPIWLKYPLLTIPVLRFLL
jgi:hypothetical protein